MIARHPLLLWTGLPFLAMLGLASAVLVLAGGDDQAVHLALLATARLMFLVFLPAYLGSALVSLFGARFAPLKRYARELGLGFAAMLTVHLSLVAALCLIGDAPPVKTFVLFGAAALCVYGMALFSIARLQRLLGRQAWALLRFAGMNYVALAFAAYFWREPMAGNGQHVLFYWPFMALSFAALVVRGIALLKAICGADAAPQSP
jgi:hypothetical protein